MSYWESKEIGSRALLGQQKWKGEYHESIVLSSTLEYPTIALFLPFSNTHAVYTICMIFFIKINGIQALP
jgi:hypothetical protein